MDEPYIAHLLPQTISPFQLLCCTARQIDRFWRTYLEREGEKQRALCSLITWCHSSSGLCSVGNYETQPGSLTLCLAWSSRVLEKSFQHSTVLFFLFDTMHVCTATSLHPHLYGADAVRMLLGIKRLSQTQSAFAPPLPIHIFFTFPPFFHFPLLFSLVYYFNFLPMLTPPFVSTLIF